MLLQMHQQNIQDSHKTYEISFHMLDQHAMQYQSSTLLAHDALLDCVHLALYQHLHQLWVSTVEHQQDSLSIPIRNQKDFQNNCCSIVLAWLSMRPLIHW